MKSSFALRHTSINLQTSEMKTFSLLLFLFCFIFSAKFSSSTVCTFNYKFNNKSTNGNQTCAAGNSCLCFSASLKTSESPLEIHATDCADTVERIMNAYFKGQYNFTTDLDFSCNVSLFKVEYVTNDF